MAAPVVEPKIYTAVCLDFETGGLDCTRCGCTQIAMHAIRLDSLETTDRYVRYIAPYEKQELGAAKRKVLKSKYELMQTPPLMDYEQRALDYSNITLSQLKSSGVSLSEVAGDIIEFARRATLSKGGAAKPCRIGQNIQFDIGFLQQIMSYGGKLKDFESTFAGARDFWGNFQPHYIDSIDLARLSFAHDGTVTSYKLELIAERMGMELDDAHDAEADVTATLGIVRTSASRLRNEDGCVDGTLKQEKTRQHFKI